VSSDYPFSGITWSVTTPPAVNPWGPNSTQPLVPSYITVGLDYQTQQLMRELIQALIVYAPKPKPTRKPKPKKRK
jgi:hypothetical protein